MSVVESIISLIRENKNTVVNVTEEGVSNSSSSKVQPEPVKPPPPPPPAKIELTLWKDGKVLIGKEKYSISEVEQKMIELQKEQEEIYKKYNVEPEMITSVQIEVGVTDQQVSSLKEALKKANVLHINYSTDFKESEWKGRSLKEQSESIKSELEQNRDEIERNLFASNRGVIRIGNDSYQLDRSILANESQKNSGKFEFDIFTAEDNKKVNIYFMSIKSLSQDLPDIGKYEYVSKSYNLRDENTFWGDVKIGNKIYEISSGYLEILSHSEKNFVAEFEIELTDGTRISGKHQGVIQMVDWRNTTAQN